jgi:BirA family biotin operon repressor/biotin-[acetyl-CoA-carboxylase] ligase
MLESEPRKLPVVVEPLPLEVALKLARLLADGESRSRVTLSEELGDPAALPFAVRELERLGVQVQSAPGGSFRLTEPLEFLRRGAVLSALDEGSRSLFSGIEIRGVLDSTNRHLLDRAGDLRKGWACLAEYQSAGHGRRGRVWVAPLASNICLSVLWHLTAQSESPGGLSLAMGVAVARSVEEAGAQDIGLKWPNDLLWKGRKLGGVLVEAVSGPSAPHGCVVGVGLNVRMPRASARAIDQPWCDLQEVLGTYASRNRVAGRLLHHLLLALHTYERLGLQPFLGDWVRLDLTAGRPVTLRWNDRAVTGVALGVTSAGELTLYHDGGIRHYSSGDVTLRSG